MNLRKLRIMVATIQTSVILVIFVIVFTNYAYAIDVGTLPFEVAINENTNKAYVAHGDGTVHVIDTATNTNIKIIDVSPGNALTGITVDPLSNKIYVANSGTNEVAVIDGIPGSPNEDTVIATIPLISPLDGLTPVGIFPADVEINTNLSTLYVSNILSLTVVVIDISPDFPVDVNPITTENTIIDVLDGTENALTDDFRFDSPARFAFDPNTNLMYMTNFFKNQVSVLDGTQNSFIGGNPVLPSITISDSAVNGIEINPTNKKMYVANSAINKISVIDVDPNNIETTYNTEIDTIDVGVTPIGVGVDEINNRIFVSNKDEGTLSVIDGSSDTVVKTIPTDTSTATPRPKGLDVHSVTGKAYVVNAGIGSVQGTVSVIDFEDNSPPVARAGPDQVVNEGTLVTLDGSGSLDSEGDPFSFGWVEVPSLFPSVTLSDPTSSTPTFTAPLVDADRLITFSLIVADPALSIPDFVNVIVKDTTSFTVSSTLTDGVVSGNQIIGDVFAGSTYSLRIDNPVDALPNAELQQLVLGVGVDDTGVNFEFTESPQVLPGTPEPDINTVLFFDLTLAGATADFSQAINFDTEKLPKIQFLIDKNFEPSPEGFKPAPRFTDDCLDVQLQLFDDGTGQWEQEGNSLVANTNKIYVSNVGLGATPGTLSVIDGSTNNLIDTITVGLAPKIIAFDQSTNRIYVANQGSGTVSVIDGSTNSVLAVIPVGLSPLSNPIKPVVNPITGLIYVSNQVIPTVSVIDGNPGSPTENTVIAEIPVEVSSGIDVDTTLNKIYVANGFRSIVSVIDGDPSSGTYNTVIATISVPLPTGLIIDSSNNRAYASNFDDRSVTVIDTTTDTVIATIQVGSSPSNLDFNPTTNRLYVANQASGSVSIIDTTINAEITRVETGIAPFDVAANPNTNRIYVANRGSGTVSVIDGMPGSPTENQVIDTITGFSTNFGVVLNPAVPNPVRDPSADVLDGNQIQQCAYIGEPPHFSKFVIGGVITTLSLGGLGGSIDLSPPTFNAIVFDEDDYQLDINGNLFKLPNFENQIDTQTFNVGEKITIKFTVFEQRGIDGLIHFEFLTNLTGMNRDYTSSDTYLIYDKDSEIAVIDPNGLFSETAFSISDDGNIVFITVELTFAKPLDSSDVIIRMWDQKFQSLDTIIKDMIVITGDEAELSTSSESQDTVGDSQDGTTETTVNIPEWLKKNAGWWSQGQLDDSTFTNSVQYLIQNQIIDIQTLPNVSVDPDEEDKFAEEEEIVSVPEWIKNNAGWWSEGQIDDQTFIKGIEYLVENGIIVV